MEASAGDKCAPLDIPCQRSVHCPTEYVVNKAVRYFIPIPHSVSVMQFLVTGRANQSVVSSLTVPFSMPSHAPRHPACLTGLTSSRQQVSIAGGRSNDVCDIKY